MAATFSSLPQGADLTSEWSARPARLMIIIRSLATGGAELQLLELLERFDHGKFDVTLVLLYDQGDLVARARRIPGVRLVTIGKRNRWDIWRPVMRLLSTVHHLRPEIIYGIMVDGLLVAQFLRFAASGAAVACRIGNSDKVANGDADWLGKLLFRIGAYCSRFADYAIFNSEAGHDFYFRSGYRPKRWAIIRNGVDLVRFSPDPTSGRSFRDELSIGPGQQLVGIVGRLKPIKDHATFLRAAAIVLASRPQVVFLCVGAGLKGHETALRNLSSELRIARSVIWHGLQPRLPAIYNAMDICVISSVSEGCPNVIAEAMACGTPCVSTAVGDAQWMLRSVGIVTPPRDPQALASAIIVMIDQQSLDGGELRRANREAAVARFGMATFIESTENALLELAIRIRAKKRGQLIGSNVTS